MFDRWRPAAELDAAAPVSLPRTASVIVRPAEGNDLGGDLRVVLWGVQGAPVSVIRRIPTPGTVAGINPATVAGMDPASVFGIDPATVAGVDPATVARIDPATVARVDPATVARVDPATVAVVDPATVAGIDPATVARVDLATVARVDPATVAEIDPATVFASRIVRAPTSVSAPAVSVYKNLNFLPALKLCMIQAGYKVYVLM